MKKEYNFSNAKKNPYIQKLTTKITLNISNDVLAYFEEMSIETGIPYQNLINLYLIECVREKKRLYFGSK